MQNRLNTMPAHTWDGRTRAPLATLRQTARMPHGLRRYHHTGHTHFVTFTTYHPLPHLNTSALCDAVVETLEHARVKYRFRVYGFVVMPEHVHVLLSEPERASLAQGILSWKVSSATQTATSRKAGVPLWQKRGYDRNIRDHHEFLEKLDYIHENPVRRNLCARPQDWRWSSCRHYATGEGCGVEIESEWRARKRELRKRD